MQVKQQSRPRAIVKKKAQKYGTNNSGGRQKANSSRFATSFFNISDIRQRMKHLQRKKKQGRQLGFIHNKEIYGNDLKGEQWVQEQKKRHEGEQQYHPQVVQPNEDDQVIYIEPSASQKRLEELRKMGRTFYDQTFPPNDYSMTGAFGYIPEWDPIQWKKISVMMKKAKIFQGKAQPNDIQQGYLGDCYFLAGLASLAERPDRIYDLFMLDEKNDMNYYSVKMIYRGKWRRIDLDQYIPAAYNQPAFSKTSNDQVWVMILEKAWAKLYGSYKQLQGGFPEEPLHDLTGAPIKQVFLKNSQGDNQWQYLLSASQKQYAMVASSNPGSDTNQSESGIFQGHAYTFLNATQIIVNNKKERIVQLRNPWGQGEFKGRWSDLDPVWNQVSASEKERVSYKKNTNDGIFFMDYNSFLRDFRNVTVAEINDNASYVYEYYVDPQATGAYFTIQIKTAAKYSFQVDKTPQRSFTGQMQQKYRYPEALLEVGQLQSRQVRKLQGYISKRRTLFKSYDLTPGTYVAFVKIDFNSNFQKDYEIVLAVYSQYACKIKLSTTQESIKFNHGKQTNWSGKRKKKSELPPPKEKNQNNNYRWVNNNHRDYNINSKMEELSKKKDNANSSSTFLGSQSNLKNKNSNKKSDYSNQIGDNFSLVKKSTDAQKKKKKIRRIQVEKTKVETIQEDPNGESIVKINENEIKKQSVETKVQGGKNIKTKQKQNKVESIEVRFQGETQHKKQKFTEIVTISERKPDGKVMEKVSSKQRQVQTMEEDDDNTDSFLRSLEGSKASQLSKYNQQNLQRYQSNEEREKAQFKNIQNKLNNGQQLNKRDELRYPEPDSQSGEQQ